MDDSFIVLLSSTFFLSSEWTSQDSANTDAVAPSLKNTDLQLNTGDTITSTITLDRAPHNTASCMILMDATLLYGPGEQVAFRQFPKFRGIVLYK